jgi:hypothetical protein
MNILIKNYTEQVNPAEISAMIQVYTLPEHYNRMIIGNPIVIKDERRLKSPTVIVTKQGNGNLCFDFKTKEDEQ